MDAIRTMIDPQCSVLRDNCRRSIAADHVVTGDIVFLDAGDRVPADLRLLTTHALHMDEAALTGESLPIEKQTGSLAQSTALADRCNMAIWGAMLHRDRAWEWWSPPHKTRSLGRSAPCCKKWRSPKPR
nr:hypothetical protein [Iodidimonas gelatinilytica]